MAGFANSGDIPFLVGFAAAIAVLTGIATVLAMRLRPQASNIAIVLVSVFVAPALIFALGFAAFLLIPAGDSPDGPGMLLVGVISLTIVALPISLLTSFVVVATRRRQDGT